MRLHRVAACRPSQTSRPGPAARRSRPGRWPRSGPSCPGSVPHVPGRPVLLMAQVAPASSPWQSHYLVSRSSRHPSRQASWPSAIGPETPQQRGQSRCEVSTRIASGGELGTCTRWKAEMLRSPQRCRTSRLMAMRLGFPNLSSAGIDTTCFMQSGSRGVR
jgi:hypothetical protein